MEYAAKLNYQESLNNKNQFLGEKKSRDAIEEASREEKTRRSDVFQISKLNSSDSASSDLEYIKNNNYTKNDIKLNDKYIKVDLNVRNSDLKSQSEQTYDVKYNFQNKPLDDSESFSSNSMIMSSEYTYTESQPKLLTAMKDQSAALNQTARFTCEFNCQSENYFVKWFHSGQLINANVETEKYKIENKQNLSELRIQKIDKTDEGIYKCRIENTAGEITSIAYLHVGKGM